MIFKLYEVLNLNQLAITQLITSLLTSKTMERNSSESKNIVKCRAEKKSLPKDPSSQGGYSLLFDSRIATQMKYIDYDRNVKDLGSGQVINLKIYTFGYKPNISRVKIQIDSDGDPFFSSVFQTDQNMFLILRDQQKLNLGLQQFPTLLIKSFNKIQQLNGQTTGKVSATFLIYSDGKCKLSLWHTSQYKNIQIISLDFNQENQNDTESKVAFKFQTLRKKLIRTQERLQKINQIIRQKNPSLLMQLSKTTQAHIASSKY